MSRTKKPTPAEQLVAALMRPQVDAALGQEFDQWCADNSALLAQASDWNRDELKAAFAAESWQARRWHSLFMLATDAVIELLRAAGREGEARGLAAHAEKVTQRLALGPPARGAKITQKAEERAKTFRNGLANYYFLEGLDAAQLTAKEQAAALEKDPQLYFSADEAPYSHTRMTREIPKLSGAAQAKARRRKGL